MQQLLNYTALLITDTKLYRKVVTLSAQDDVELPQQLKSDFKRTITYYSTYKVRIFESLLYKIITRLQKTNTCIGLRAEQIFSVNI